MDTLLSPNIPDGGAPPSQLAGNAPQTSRLAIASLVLGILGFLILPAVGGLICGLIAWFQISRNPTQLKGSGFAIAGICVSGMMLLLIPIVAIMAGMLLPALSQAKNRAQTIMGMSNVKQLSLGVSMYAADHEDTLPVAATWCDQIMPMIGSPLPFQRPSDPNGTRGAYGLNVRVAGAKQGTVHRETVLIFELATPGWNRAGGPEIMRQPSRRGETMIVGFADGHAEAVPANRLSSLRWDP